jgi:hypothetical protein
MQNGIVTKTVLFYEVDALKDFQGFVRIKKADKLSLGTFLGNIQYPLSFLPIFRIHEPDHLRQGFYGSQPLVSGSDNIAAIRFKVIEESKKHLGGKMLDSERGDLYGKSACHKGQKQRKDIPIRFDGLIATAFYVWQILIKKSIDTCLKPHISSFFETAKLNND